MNPILILVLALLFLPSAALAQSTAFTYQGRLNHSGSPATGLYEITFTLYDSATNGTIIATPITLAPVPVTNGLFTATLDFGPSAFTGAPRWLEIAVTLYGTDQPVVTLTPRQPMTPTPYAVWAATAGTLSSLIDAPLDIINNAYRILRLEGNAARAPNIIAGSDINTVLDQRTIGATIAGGGAPFWGANTAGYFGTVCGGAANSAIGGFSTIGGGHHNVCGGPRGFIGGGQLNFATNGASVVGGGNNSASGWGSSIGGGAVNQGQGDYAVIAGGFGNTGGGFYSTILGGWGNNSRAYAGVIGGGMENLTDGVWSTVSGGMRNVATGEGATVSGGIGNSCSNAFATIPGGCSNLAAAEYSFAAGRKAQAWHRGALVWADSANTPFNSEGNNEFSVRARGGVRFVTAIDTNGTPTAGVSLAPGSGSWSSLSDRNAKENFTPTQPREVLDKVAALPISTWNYKSQDKSIRHIGPTAQDFHAAFSLGENDRTITTVDAAGVSLAAIQGLNQLVKEQAAKLQSKEAEVEELRRRLSKLEEMLLNPLRPK